MASIAQEKIVTSNEAGNPKVESGIVIRRLETLEEYEACVNLQKETWGTLYADSVPSSLLRVVQKVGGIVAGAFDRQNKLLGFVFGITGVRDGKLIHWSHMLAVSKHARRHSLGKQLKSYQRQLLLSMGIDVAQWTFDPLVARNANLNLNRLGAEVTEYVKDMYPDSGSDLHRGLGMDRFIATWHLRDERIDKMTAGEFTPRPGDFTSAPIVNTQLGADNDIIPVERELPVARRIRVEIPSDIETTQTKDSELGLRWRLNTRRVFIWYQERGYAVRGFYIDQESNRAFYYLSPK